MVSWGITEELGLILPASVVNMWSDTADHHLSQFLSQVLVMSSKNSEKVFGNMFLQFQNEILNDFLKLVLAIFI